MPVVAGLKPVRWLSKPYVGQSTNVDGDDVAGVSVAVFTFEANSAGAVAPNVADVLAPLYATVTPLASAGELSRVFESFVAPLASESVSVTGFDNGSEPMIAAPLASRRLTVSPRVAAVPAGGDALLSVSATDETTPSSTSATVFDLPATIVAVVVFCESAVPVPLVVPYVTSPKVSTPAGALSVIVQVRPLADVVQFGEPAAKFVTTGVPPFTEIDADCVLTETYRGRRSVLDVLAVDGTVMDTAMLCSAGDVDDTGCTAGTELPPPPPHPATHAQKEKSSTSLRIIIPIFSTAPSFVWVFRHTARLKPNF